MSRPKNKTWPPSSSSPARDDRSTLFGRTLVSLSFPFPRSPVLPFHPLEPHWIFCKNPPVNRTVVTVRPGQHTGALEKLSHDLATGKAKSLFEQLHPFLYVKRVVLDDPGVEAPVAIPEYEDGFRVGDRGLDFQSIANDSLVGEEAFRIPVSKPRHHRGVEAPIGPTERLSLLEDREPGEARLVDLEHQPLEQLVVPAERETVLGVVIWAVPFVAGCEVAVARHGRNGERGTGNRERGTRNRSHLILSAKREGSTQRNWRPGVQVRHRSTPARSFGRSATERPRERAARPGARESFRAPSG